MFHSRKKIRLAKYDYSTAGYYFVTICSKDRIEYFGKIENGQIKLGPIGIIAENLWKKIPARYPVSELDEFVVMPNHLHGIVIIKPGLQKGDTPRHTATPLLSLVPNSLSSIVNHYKGSVTKECNKNGRSKFQWQGSFYDHVIRDDESLHRIREYIKNNPLKWELDRNNPQNLWI